MQKGDWGIRTFCTQTCFVLRVGGGRWWTYSNWKSHTRHMELHECNHDWSQTVDALSFYQLIEAIFITQFRCTQLVFFCRVVWFFNGGIFASDVLKAYHGQATCKIRIKWWEHTIRHTPLTRHSIDELRWTRPLSVVWRRQTRRPRCVGQESFLQTLKINPLAKWNRNQPWRGSGFSYLHFIVPTH